MDERIRGLERCSNHEDIYPGLVELLTVFRASPESTTMCIQCYDFLQWLVMMIEFDSSDLGAAAASVLHYIVYYNRFDQRLAEELAPLAIRLTPFGKPIVSALVTRVATDALVAQLGQFSNAELVEHINEPGLHEGLLHECVRELVQRCPVLDEDASGSGNVIIASNRIRDFCGSVTDIDVAKLMACLDNEGRPWQMRYLIAELLALLISASDTYRGLRQKFLQHGYSRAHLANVIEYLGTSSILMIPLAEGYLSWGDADRGDDEGAWLDSMLWSPSIRSIAGEINSTLDNDILQHHLLLLRQRCEYYQANHARFMRDATIANIVQAVNLNRLFAESSQFSDQSNAEISSLVAVLTWSSRDDFPRPLLQFIFSGPFTQVLLPLMTARDDLLVLATMYASMGDDNRDQIMSGEVFTFLVYDAAKHGRDPETDVMIGQLAFTLVHRDDGQLSAEYFTPVFMAVVANAALTFDPDTMIATLRQAIRQILMTDPTRVNDFLQVFINHIIDVLDNRMYEIDEMDDRSREIQEGLSRAVRHIISCSQGCESAVTFDLKVQIVDGVSRLLRADAVHPAWLPQCRRLIVATVTSEIVISSSQAVYLIGRIQENGAVVSVLKFIDTQLLQVYNNESLEYLTFILRQLLLPYANDAHQLLAIHNQVPNLYANLLELVERSAGSEFGVANALEILYDAARHAEVVPVANRLRQELRKRLDLLYRLENCSARTSMAARQILQLIGVAPSSCATDYRWWQQQQQ